jgi:dihydrolipoamide dehydrogenase
MLDLYSWTTPNGDKIHIMLEETGLAYRAIPVNLGAGEQRSDSFRAINRNGKIPALVDPEGPEGPVTIAESGAILIYLAEKSGQFLPRATQARFAVLQWLMFQMSAIGPMLGQLYHFRTHTEQIPHAIDRFTTEVQRILGVVETQLATLPASPGGPYLAFAWRPLPRRRLLDRRHRQLPVAPRRQTARPRPRRAPPPVRLARHRRRPPRRPARPHRPPPQTMSSRDVDVAVIGAGTAGLSARHAAVKAGASALLIDRGPLGTMCARVGCMPSKLLIAASEAAEAVREAPGFGVHSDNLRVDGPAVLARVRSERDRFVSFVLDDCRALADRGDLVLGTATLVEPNVLTIDATTRVRFRTLVVATGSSPALPEPYCALHGLVLTNDGVFELPDLPPSVLVVGTGAIGLELGQALHRLGVRTTIVGHRGTLGPIHDPAVRAAAHAVLAGELDLHPDHTLDRLTAGGDGVVASFRTPDGRTHDGTWARVLLAAGRRPRTAGLGLELAGIRFDERNRPRDVDPHTMRAGTSHVFFAGDVAGIRPLLHEAADEGHIAGTNAARHPDADPRPRRTELSVVFTDPNLAVVGGGVLASPPASHAAGEVDWTRQGRARVLRKNRGLARVYARRSDRVLTGAEIAGPHAEHLAHLLAWVVQQGLTVDAALALPFYHPVLEEGLRTALRDLKHNLS